MTKSWYWFEYYFWKNWYKSIYSFTEEQYPPPQIPPPPGSLRHDSARSRPGDVTDAASQAAQAIMVTDSTKKNPSSAMGTPSQNGSAKETPKLKPKPEVKIRLLYLFLIDVVRKCLKWNENTSRPWAKLFFSSHYYCTGRWMDRVFFHCFHCETKIFVNN